MGIWYQFIRYEFICTVGTQVLSTTHGTSYYVTQYKKYVPYIHTYIYMCGIIVKYVCICTGTVYVCMNIGMHIRMFNCSVYLCYNILILYH